MILAVEDLVAEVLVSRMIEFSVPGAAAGFTPLAKKGKTYLRAKATALNRAAQQCTVVLVADLDNLQVCLVEEVGNWFPNGQSARMFFAIAVVEIESWVLADRPGISSFLGVPEHRIPINTDLIGDPKQHLVNLARKSRSKSLKADLVPVPGSTAQVGPAYNSRISDFIERLWDPVRAQQSSRSLNRALRRLAAILGRPL